MGLFEDWVDGHGVTSVIGRVSLGEAGGQGVETLLRLCQGDAGRQTGEAVAPRGVQAEGDPRLDVVELIRNEPRPRHADHRVELAVQRQAFADDRGIPAEPALPE